MCTCMRACIYPHVRSVLVPLPLPLPPQVWVSSPHNGIGYYGLKEEVGDALSREHFAATLSGSRDTSVTYARTGYLGFMSKSDRTGGFMDGLYIVGSLDEALNIRGFRYHPSDIEASINRSHKNIIGRLACGM